MAHHYVLLDACVAAAHFAPKTTARSNLKNRSTALLTGSSEKLTVHYLIPSFCIAEVFAVFEKYRWGRTWNKQVKASNCLTPGEFHDARNKFGTAIHNGAELLQVDLNRYHILCVDLISPINNAYKIRRDRSKKKNVSPAKTYDMLIVAMGIWMQHQLGREALTVVTGDERLSAVVERARSVKLGKPMKRHLSAVAALLGLSYDTGLYPTVVNLTRATRSELEARFPHWTPAW